ncbi:MAG: NTP transferase domain-containing protein [Candidatus Latescibacteria bacterium]|nr:NTP transferase domain-containing protein [Candidatus Latescibacterota bacterium]
MTGIILAAGKSKRMGLTHSKVLLPLNGRPVLSYLIDLAQKADLKPLLIVISPLGKDIEQTFPNADVQFVIQKEQKGTADAIRACDALLNLSDDIFILYGDTPLLTLDTILALKQIFFQEKADVALLTAYLQNPFGYGRIVRDQNGKIISIIEEKDADEQTKKIQEINVGVYVFRCAMLKPVLQKLLPSPVNGEYYLTSALTEIAKHNGKIVSVTTDNPDSCFGINTPEDWEKVQQLFKASRN